MRHSGMDQCPFLFRYNPDTVLQDRKKKKEKRSTAKGKENNNNKNKAGGGFHVMRQSINSDTAKGGSRSHKTTAIIVKNKIKIKGPDDSNGSWGSIGVHIHALPNIIIKYDILIIRRR